MSDKVWTAEDRNAQHYPNHADIARKDDPWGVYRKWTVSPRPGISGWNTDGGHDGYGLLEEEAKYLAECTRLMMAVKEGYTLLDIEGGAWTEDEKEGARQIIDAYRTVLLKAAKGDT